VFFREFPPAPCFSRALAREQYQNQYSNPGVGISESPQAIHSKHGARTLVGEYPETLADGCRPKTVSVLDSMSGGWVELVIARPKLAARVS
jgi:hypothetical protein